MMDRRAVVTGLATVAVAGLAHARAWARQSVAPVRATRSGLVFDNRYYGFPEDVDGSDLVFDSRQNSTWQYHTFPDDTEGVLRHVATGLTFLTVAVPRNEPPEVELLHLGSAVTIDRARLAVIGYAAQTCAWPAFAESFSDCRRGLPHAQQGFSFRFLDEEPSEDDEDPQLTIRQAAPPLLATEGDRFGDLWVYPPDRGAIWT